MRKIKLSVALAAIGTIAAAVWARELIDQSGPQMTVAASRLFATLDESQKAKATFAFDSPERLNWHFIPRPRKGLPLKEMTSAQRALAFGLVQSGVSDSGFSKATTIMSLEQVLKDMEQGKGPTRDPELYFLSFFGEPSTKGKWGWRVEGHHLSLNFMINEGKVVSATPAFFGSNPAEVRQGPRAGLRVLAELEDRALRLLQALDESQRKEATVEAEAPPEVRAPNTPQPPTAAAVGIPYSKLTDDQKSMLRALIEAYAGDMPDDIAAAWLGEIKDAGTESIRFAWMGAPDRSAGHAYRVQGPTFLIEFNNTQNGANHIHSLWRNMLGDFGTPVTAK